MAWTKIKTTSATPFCFCSHVICGDDDEISRHYSHNPYKFANFLWKRSLSSYDLFHLIGKSKYVFFVVRIFVLRIFSSDWFFRQRFSLADPWNLHTLRNYISFACLTHSYESNMPVAFSARGRKIESFTLFSSLLIDVYYNYHASKNLTRR